MNDKELEEQVYKFLLFNDVDSEFKVDERYEKNKTEKKLIKKFISWLTFKHNYYFNKINFGTNENPFYPNRRKLKKMIKKEIKEQKNNYDYKKEGIVQFIGDHLVKTYKLDATIKALKETAGRGN